MLVLYECVKLHIVLCCHLLALNWGWGVSEKSSGDKVAKAYLVCPGVEPLAFQNLFPYWEPDTLVRSLALQVGPTLQRHALTLILIQ